MAEFVNLFFCVFPPRHLTSVSGIKRGAPAESQERDSNSKPSVKNFVVDFWSFLSCCKKKEQTITMADAFAGDLSAWIQSLPPVTRSWLVCSFLITAAVTLDFVPVDQLIFDFDKICNNLELWRFLTSFCYCGGRLDEFHSLTLLYLVYIESRRYEQNPYPVPGSGGDGSASRTIDCAFCYLFCALGLLLTLLSWTVILLLVPVALEVSWPGGMSKKLEEFSTRRGWLQKALQKAELDAEQIHQF